MKKTLLIEAGARRVDQRRTTFSSRDKKERDAQPIGPERVQFFCIEGANKCGPRFL